MSLKNELQRATKMNDQVGLKVKELAEKARIAASNGEHILIEYIQSIDLYDEKELWFTKEMDDMVDRLAHEDYELDMSYNTFEDDENGYPIWRVTIDWMV